MRIHRVLQGIDTLLDCVEEAHGPIAKTFCAVVLMVAWLATAVVMAASVAMGIAHVFIRYPDVALGFVGALIGFSFALMLHSWVKCKTGRGR